MARQSAVISNPTMKCSSSLPCIVDQMHVVGLRGGHILQSRTIVDPTLQIRYSNNIRILVEDRKRNYYNSREKYLSSSSLKITEI